MIADKTSFFFFWGETRQKVKNLLQLPKFNSQNSGINL